MKLGICTDPFHAAAAKEAGFDYIEYSMSSLASVSDEEFERMAQALESSGLRVEAMNVMLPGSFRLTGPDADLSPIAGYLEKGFSRGAQLGQRVQVFGSGGARNVPDEWPMDRALDELSAFLELAAPIAGKYGVAIAIEPLNPGECNIINTVSDAVALARRVALPNVGALADWYHMAVQNEGTAGMLDAGGLLWHCHIANPEGRRFPLPGDGADFSQFFGALKRIGYAGRVSIEGGGDESEFKIACERLRACL